MVKIITVAVHPRYLLESERKHFYSQRLERKTGGQTMNFDEATTKAKAGSKMRRPSWGDDMYAWWAGAYFLHTHPYFDFQVKSPSLTGYFYVVEKDDATATDWELVSA